MLGKLAADIVKAQKVMCGEIDLILGSADCGRLNGAICPSIKPIIARFHPSRDEIYFVPGSWVHITMYDPKAAKYAGPRLGTVRSRRSFMQG